MTKSFIFVNLLCYFGYVHGDQRNVQCSGLCHCKTIINLKTQPQVKCGKFWKQAMLKEFRTCSKLNSLAGRVTEFFCVTHFPFSVMRSLVLVVDSCFLLCTCVIILILDSIISHCSQEMSPRSSPESRVDKTRKSGGNRAYFDSR